MVSPPGETGAAGVCVLEASPDPCVISCGRNREAVSGPTCGAAAMPRRSAGAPPPPSVSSNASRISLQFVNRSSGSFAMAFMTTAVTSDDNSGLTVRGSGTASWRWAIITAKSVLSG